MLIKNIGFDSDRDLRRWSLA